MAVWLRFCDMTRLTGAACFMARRHEYALSLLHALRLSLLHPSDANKESWCKSGKTYCIWHPRLKICLTASIVQGREVQMGQVGLTAQPESQKQERLVEEGLQPRHQNHLTMQCLQGLQVVDSLMSCEYILLPCDRFWRMFSIGLAF